MKVDLPYSNTMATYVWVDDWEDGHVLGTLESHAAVVPAQYVPKKNSIEFSIDSPLFGDKDQYWSNWTFDNAIDSWNALLKETVGSGIEALGFNQSGLRVQSLWASKHSVGKVLFKWSKKKGAAVTGWNLMYRFRKIGGKAKWSGWTNKSYPASTFEALIPIKTDYVIEIHAQAKGDTTWSTGIITTPAGGKYQAMKTAHVINTTNGKRLTEKKVGNSAVYHTAINLKVGQTISVKPDYDYPVKSFKKRPRLYPNHMLYDIGDKSMITITKPDKSVYTGGIIQGIAKIKATKAGKTTIIFRAPNGRTMIGDVTITP